jgi:ferredoxin
MSKKDGKATLLLSVAKKQVWVRNMPTEQEALTREVAQACPVRVIKVQ